MYPKFQDENSVLVTNHREAGENYATSEGSTETLIGSAAALLSSMRGPLGTVAEPGGQARYYDFKQKKSVFLPSHAVLERDSSLFVSVCGGIHDSYVAQLKLLGGHNSETECSYFCSAVLGADPEDARPVGQTAGAALSACLASRLASVGELCRWQFDFNLRRAGASL